MNVKARRSAIREIEAWSPGRATALWAGERALGQVKPPLRLAEYRGYIVVHAHDEGRPCNRHCKYRKTVRHAIASCLARLKGAVL